MCSNSRNCTYSAVQESRSIVRAGRRDLLHTHLHHGLLRCRYNVQHRDSTSRSLDTRIYSCLQSGLCLVAWIRCFPEIVSSSCIGRFGKRIYQKRNGVWTSLSSIFLRATDHNPRNQNDVKVFECARERRHAWIEAYDAFLFSLYYNDWLTSIGTLLVYRLFHPHSRTYTLLITLLCVMQLTLVLMVSFQPYIAGLLLTIIRYLLPFHRIKDDFNCSPPSNDTAFETTLAAKYVHLHGIVLHLTFG